MSLDRAAACALLTEWTASDSLRKHALAVEAAVRVLEDDPDVRLAALLRAAEALELKANDQALVRAGLRALKAELHLLTALADLGGVWDLDQVTGALTRFADAAVRAALAAAAAVEGRIADPRSFVVGGAK